MAEFRTADGYAAAAGDELFVRHDDGTFEKCEVADVISRFKVAWTKPDLRGYIGARYSVVFKRRPE